MKWFFDQAAVQPNRGLAISPNEPQAEGLKFPNIFGWIIELKILGSWLTGWWFHFFIFNPKISGRCPFWLIIFQMGWFNHQPAHDWSHLTIEKGHRSPSQKGHKELPGSWFLVHLSVRISGILFSVHQFWCINKNPRGISCETQVNSTPNHPNFFVWFWRIPKIFWCIFWNLSTGIPR